MRRPVKVLCVSLLLLTPILTTAAVDGQDVIDYRQHIMKTLNEQAAAIGQILSMVIPDDNVVAHLDAIALTASTALKAFEPKVQGGEAKPDVWTNWADFSKRMNQFVQMSATMAKTAHEQGKDAGLAQVVDALSCKGCHERYRKEKKKTAG
ncbi:MAG TPA: cytochrome c [Steroidobacteraceae bacterium]